MSPPKKASAKKAAASSSSSSSGGGGSKSKKKQKKEEEKKKTAKGSSQAENAPEGQLQSWLNQVSTSQRTGEAKLSQSAAASASSSTAAAITTGSEKRSLSSSLSSSSSSASSSSSSSISSSSALLSSVSTSLSSLSPSSALLSSASTSSSSSSASSSAAKKKAKPTPHGAFQEFMAKIGMQSHPAFTYTPGSCFFDAVDASVKDRLCASSSPALRPAPWNARRCVGRTLASAAFLELDEVNEAINSGEQTEKGTFEHKIYSILTQSGSDLPPGAAIKRSPHFLSRRHLERHLTPNRVNTSVFQREGQQEE